MLHIIHFTFCYIAIDYRTSGLDLSMVDATQKKDSPKTKNTNSSEVLVFMWIGPRVYSHIFVKLWHPTSRASKYFRSFMAIFLFTYYNLRDMADALVCGTQEKPNHWNANNYPTHKLPKAQSEYGSNAHSLRKGNVQSTQQVKRLLPYSTVSTISSLRTKNSIH